MMKADRIAPPEVAPVTFGGVRYEVPHWGKQRGLDQNGGYLAAKEASTGKELWTLRVYQINYDPKMEMDAQDIFITSLKKTFFGDKLKVTDERGWRYLVDVKQRTAVPAD